MSNETKKLRVCIDCGKNISDLHHNAKRCKKCSKERKKLQDKKRHDIKRIKTIKWHYFIEDPETKLLSHRNARGSKLRYWLDKICKDLSVNELEFVLYLWDWRVSNPDISRQLRREYRTCAGIVRDWRDYYVINNVFDGVSFDAETGVIFNSDGSYLTVDFDEENESYLVRNSEGTVVCKY